MADAKQTPSQAVTQMNMACSGEWSGVGLGGRGTVEVKKWSLTVIQKRKKMMVVSPLSLFLRSQLGRLTGGKRRSNSDQDSKRVTLQLAMKQEAKICLRVMAGMMTSCPCRLTVLNIFRFLLLCAGCLVCGWLQIKAHKHHGTN